MGKTAENQVTIEKLANALRTEGNIAGQINQAIHQAQQNVAAIDNLEREALEALERAGISGHFTKTQANETIQALAKGCRDNAIECAKSAETQLPKLKMNQKLSQTLMDALKPAIHGKRGADLGRRVLAAVKAFKG